jgi:hypothetical protein
MSAEIRVDWCPFVVEKCSNLKLPPNKNLGSFLLAKLANYAGVVSRQQLFSPNEL